MAKGTRRHQPSSIDKLPVQVRDLISRLRTQNGYTIEAIVDHLKTLDHDISHSAMGRHVKKLADIGERMRSSRQIAEALTQRFGDQPDNRIARANIELMHDVVMQTITAAEIDEETGEARPVTFDPENVMFLSLSLQALAGAEKTTADRIVQAEKRAAEKATREAAKNAEGAAKAQGLSVNGVKAIVHAVLGADV